jgi:pyruvate dehydrogenase E1 component alpha subunit
MPNDFAEHFRLLSDPYEKKEISLPSDWSADHLKDCLIKMVTIRSVERKLAEQKKIGVIGGPVHLGIGQEAVAVGVSTHLKKTDMVFGTHRSHCHLLALGSDLKRFFAEILGKNAGLSGGMGGSMHLVDRSVGFVGSVPIVAGTVPVAVGAALSAKIDASGAIAVSYFGDGAAEEGVVHESLNLASSMNLPIIFVVENNLFASHMHISQRQPQGSMCRFAEANQIDYGLVNGNNLIEVADAMRRLSIAARDECKPGFIEAVTYRWLGHVDWREDIDVGVTRSEDEVRAWKQHDPINQLSQAMIKNDIINESFLEKKQHVITDEIDLCWEWALEQDWPHSEETLSRVYFK